MKRRNFISESGRWLLLGGLLGTSGVFLYRNQFGDPENCFKNPFCKSCNQFSSCGIVTKNKESDGKEKRG
jgi:hypothetical protein